MMSLKHAAITIAIAVSTATTTTHAQTASPYCQADLIFDNTLDFFDVSAFLIAYDDDDLTADFDNSGNLDFFDISAFLGLYSGGCPDLTDTDSDRIPDYAETDNALYFGPFQTGTNPLSRDTDGDGLDDGDEILGTTDGLVLPNANPVRKDIYVECDWFQGEFQGRNENYRPTAAVEARVRAAFLNGSTPNPYGLPDGIVIHLDYGQDEQHTGGNQLPGSPDVIQFDNDFNAYKAKHFDPKRKGYYHYAIFTNRYNSSTNGSSGIAEINGDDFIVSMVNYNSTNNMANTIMHELGHNLGLRHGGNQNRNNKPNYNSVMNYRHQFPGVDTTGSSFGNGVLDYSHGMNILLNENAVLESEGVNGTTPIDWNNNGSIDPAPYTRNLNCNTGTTRPCGTGTNCYDSVCTTLNDYNDWVNINWNRLNNSSDRRIPEIVPCDNYPGKQFE
ncbi:MAG: M12 family metallo-peptidase [Phycisphaerales bacterium]